MTRIPSRIRRISAILPLALVAPFALSHMPVIVAGVLWADRAVRR